MRRSIVSATIVACCAFAPSAHGTDPTTTSRQPPIVLKADSTTQLVAATVTGAATAHGALSDNSDATYVTLEHPPIAPWQPSGVLVTLRDLALPPGAQLEGIRIRARVAAAGPVAANLFAFAAIPLGGSGPSITATVASSAPTTLMTANLFVGKTAAELNQATHGAGLDPAGGALRVYELDMLVYYTCPTATPSSA